MELLDLPVTELKEKLANGQDFAQIMKFFFDRFVDEPNFMKASTPTRVPNVVAEAVSQVFSSIRQTQTVLSSWEICEVPLLNLLHGSVAVGDTKGVILWATDMKTGLLGIADLKTMNTLYARLTVSSGKAARVH